MKKKPKKKTVYITVQAENNDEEDGVVVAAADEEDGLAGAHGTAAAVDLVDFCLGPKPTHPPPVLEP